MRLDLAKNEGLEDARKLLAGEAVHADEDEAEEEAKPAQEMKDKAGDKPQVMVVLRLRGALKHVLSMPGHFWRFWGWVQACQTHSAKGGPLRPEMKWHA